MSSLPAHLADQVATAHHEHTRSHTDVAGPARGIDTLPLNAARMLLAVVSGFPEGEYLTCVHVSPDAPSAVFSASWSEVVCCAECRPVSLRWPASPWCCECGGDAGDDDVVMAVVGAVCVYLLICPAHKGGDRG